MKIHTGSVPRCIWNLKGMKFSGRWLTNGFGPEAHVTGGDIFTYVPGHLWPPVVSRNQFQHLPSSGMPSKLGVMTKGQNPVAKFSSGNIDFASIIEQAILEGPFQRPYGFGQRLFQFLDHCYDYLFLVFHFHSASDLLQDILQLLAVLLKPLLQTSSEWVRSNSGCPPYRIHGQISDSMHLVCL